MGISTLTKTENNKLRVLCKRAIASGDYNSYNELGERAGIGGTTLYPFIRGHHGLGRSSATAITPYLKKYDRPRAERARNPKGVTSTLSNGNGHANGKSYNGGTKANGSISPSDRRSKAALTKDVLIRLFELRESTTEEQVRDLIDETTSNWALDGLHILATVANRAAEEVGTSLTAH